LRGEAYSIPLTTENCSKPNFIVDLNTNDFDDSLAKFKLPIQLNGDEHWQGITSPLVGSDLYEAFNPEAGHNTTSMDVVYTNKRVFLMPRGKQDSFPCVLDLSKNIGENISQVVSTNKAIFILTNNRLLSLGKNAANLINCGDSDNRNEIFTDPQDITNRIPLESFEYITNISASSNQDYLICYTNNGVIHGFGDNSFGQIKIRNKTSKAPITIKEPVSLPLKTTQISPKIKTKVTLLQLETQRYSCPTVDHVAFLDVFIKKMEVKLEVYKSNTPNPDALFSFKLNGKKYGKKHEKCQLAYNALKELLSNKSELRNRGNVLDGLKEAIQALNTPIHKTCKTGDDLLNETIAEYNEKHRFKPLFLTESEKKYILQPSFQEMPNDASNLPNDKSAYFSTSASIK
jgi:hypothetical protein